MSDVKKVLDDYLESVVFGNKEEVVNEEKKDPIDSKIEKIADEVLDLAMQVDAEDYKKILDEFLSDIRKKAIEIADKSIEAI